MPAARFVRVTANSTGSNRILHIGELEAFPQGVAPNANAALSTNEIIGDSYETSVGGGGHGDPAAVYNDALETGGRLGHGKASRLRRPTRWTWAPRYTLGEVRAWQRLDGCCQDRLSNFRLELLADNGSGGVGGVVSTTNYPGQAPTNSYASFNLAVSGNLIKQGTGTLTLQGATRTHKRW